MTIVSDFHNHVVRSSAHQMVQSAQQRGIRKLGLSEHVFQMREMQTTLAHMPLEGPTLTTHDYIQAVHTAAQEAQIEVYLGLEVDFIPEQNELIQKALQGYDWDFLIGSVHQVNNKLFEKNDTLTQEEGERLWFRYLELLQATVQSGYFQVVSHPLRMRTSNPYVPAKIIDEYERLAAEATQCNVALEINGFDVLNYPDMVRLLAKVCSHHHTPISVGSDAHNPTQIARAHQQSEKIMREADLHTIRVWKQRTIEEYSI